MLRLSKLICLLGILLGLPALWGCGLDPMEKLNQEVVSPDLQIQKQAVLELANLPDTRAVKALVNALESDPDIAGYAAVALVKQGRAHLKQPKENSVVKQITEVLKSQHVAMESRARAAWALGEIGDRRAVGDLAGVAGDADALGIEATRALEKLGVKSEGRRFDLAPQMTSGKMNTLPEPPPLAEPEPKPEAPA